MKAGIRKRMGLLALIGMTVLAVLAPAADVSAASPYTVSVNVTANVITVYYGDTPIRAMTCSTGEDTPRKGTRYLREKYRWKNLYHNSYGQYCTRYDDHMLFHSVPYMIDGDNSSLAAGLFDKLGTPDSMGCIRLLCGDAKWFYDTVPSGTKVTFYCDAENPGALGWPYCSSRQGISMKGAYDPTDPAENVDWNRFCQSAFDPEYYLAYNADYESIDQNWTDVTLKLHWVMEGMYEGRKASPYFDVNVYKGQHPELHEAYGDNLFRYIVQYNADVAKGINVPESLVRAQEGEDVTETAIATDGSTVTFVKQASGGVLRTIVFPDGTVKKSITKMDENGSVKTTVLSVESPVQAGQPGQAVQAVQQMPLEQATQ